MDLISQLLYTFHLNARVSVRAQFCGRWNLDHETTGQASFHLVASGQCWLHRYDGGEPMALGAGDLLILPRDAPHVLSDSAVRGDAPPPEFLPLDDEREDGAGVVCGHFRFEQGGSNPLLDALPDYLLIHTSTAVGGSALRGIAELLVDEARSGAPGFEAVVDRLSDALFIKALRWYLDNNRDQPGLAAAVSDPAIHHALQLIHDSPQTAWTVALLARAVAMSRTAFVARFGALMGEPPMTYVNRWRMLLAYRWLREGETVAAVAEHCGYATEAGFSKAFTRHYGLGPGAVRRAHRAAVTA
ncbi:AraC family transcriptional regulator [Arhodomonas sp. AD133]|uniref:AraC family transcriptional regulator n=1 Tax=Arhodomonas sp. AD133 TaxID=3415009 RepID=UPI003EBCA924